MQITAVSMDADFHIQFERKEVDVLSKIPPWWDELSDFADSEYDKAYFD